MDYSFCGFRDVLFVWRSCVSQHRQGARQSRQRGDGRRGRAIVTKNGKIYRNGYPINVCSSQGFAKQRDSEGVCRPSGSWSHSMSIIARRTTNNGRKLFLIWNSWGDNWCSGPYWEDMPFGSFWADYNVVDGMLSRGDSFAYSELDGFPARNLPDYGSKEYLGKLLIETESEVHDEQNFRFAAFERRDWDGGLQRIAATKTERVADSLYRNGNGGTGLRNASVGF